jgi:hypothetical protein
MVSVGWLRGGGTLLAMPASDVCQGYRTKKRIRNEEDTDFQSKGSMLNDGLAYQNEIFK